MPLDRARMEAASRRFSTKSDKIRELSRHGYSRSEIAKFLDIRYQFVRNVLVASNEASSGVSPKPVAVDGIRNRARLKVEAGGRVVLPAAFRQALGVEEGATLLAWVDRGELHLIAPSRAVQRAQEIAEQALAGAVGLADELLAERREEAKRDDRDG